MGSVHLRIACKSMHLALHRATEGVGLGCGVFMKEDFGTHYSHALWKATEADPRGEREKRRLTAEDICHLGLFPLFSSAYAGVFYLCLSIFVRP